MGAEKGALMALPFPILFWNPLKQTLTEALKSEWFIWEVIPKGIDRAVGMRGSRETV